jgi:4-aminobutyrate aminotransferase/(S)-3-amino-2-methylpropionate transaminase
MEPTPRRNAPTVPGRTEATTTAQLASYPGAPTFARAEGDWLYASEGARFLDVTAGSGAVNLGHQHPRVVARAVEQVENLVHTGSMFHAEAREELVEKIADMVPYDPCAVLVEVTGATAIEAVLKVARAATGRRLVIGFDHGYHGKSTGALSVGWRGPLKAFTPVPEGATALCPFPMLHSARAEDSAEHCLAELERIVSTTQADGNPPAALLLEPVQCTEGVLPGGDMFLDGLIAIARDAGALVIFDEVYTGMGRCGELFLSGRDGLRPDLTVLGKSLGNGFPISGVVGDPGLLNSLPSGLHTGTFAGHPVSCAAASAVIDVMRETEPWHHGVAVAEKIKTTLKSLAASNRFFSQPRGTGLMLAFDCVDADGQPSPELAQSFAYLGLGKGLLLHYGGYQNASIKLTPPLTMADDSVEYLCRTLTDIGDEIQIEFQ